MNEVEQFFFDLISPRISEVDIELELHKFSIQIWDITAGDYPYFSSYVDIHADTDLLNYHRNKLQSLLSNVIKTNFSESLTPVEISVGGSEYPALIIESAIPLKDWLALHKAGDLFE